MSGHPQVHQIDCDLVERLRALKSPPRAKDVCCSPPRLSQTSARQQERA